MHSHSIENKVIIVTGATKGMGLATSKKLLQLGAQVVMIYCRDTQNAEKVTAQLKNFSGSFLLIQADITKTNDRQDILNQTMDTFNKVDVLVNNAGIAPKAGFLKETEAQFDFILDINLKAPIFLSKLIAEQMISQGNGGSIINFASISGHRGAGGISYDAAKAGIIRATQTMANALGKHGIRVNSISPGTHKTEMNREHWENETELFKRLVSITPLKRAAEAEEIAGTVIYLASDQSSFTTGTDILVDGGYLATLPGRDK